MTFLVHNTLRAFDAFDHGFTPFDGAVELTERKALSWLL